MPLQNRVTPMGEILATPDRGLFTGNRGIIHDPATRTLLKRRWTSRAWITCLCEFRGRWRAVMAERSWTELFFLDEAVAFAAGHRPCFYCRRDDAEAFKRAFIASSASPRPLKATEMDAILHRERLSGRQKRLHPLPGPWRTLPNGAMISGGGISYLVKDGEAFPWSGAGYGPPETPNGEVRLITPPSIVRAFAAGYKPVLHPSSAR